MNGAIWVLNWFSHEKGWKESHPQAGLIETEMGGEGDVWNNLSDSRNNNLSDKLSSMYYTCVSVSEPI